MGSCAAVGLAGPPVTEHLPALPRAQPRPPCPSPPPHPQIQVGGKASGVGGKASGGGAPAGVVATPLPAIVADRVERKAGYEHTSKDVTKWQPIVKVRGAGGRGAGLGGVGISGLVAFFVPGWGSPLPR